MTSDKEVGINIRKSSLGGGLALSPPRRRTHKGRKGRWYSQVQFRCMPNVEQPLIRVQVALQRSHPLNAIDLATAGA